MTYSREREREREREFIRGNTVTNTSITGVQGVARHVIACIHSPSGIVSIGAPSPKSIPIKNSPPPDHVPSLFASPSSGSSLSSSPRRPRSRAGLPGSLCMSMSCSSSSCRISIFHITCDMNVRTYHKRQGELQVKSQGSRRTKAPETNETSSTISLKAFARSTGDGIGVRPSAIIPKPSSSRDMASSDSSSIVRV